MKDFAPATLWTIAEEFMGTVSLIVAVVLAGFFLLLFLVAFIRRGGFNGALARLGVIVGVIVGVVLAAVAPSLTQAGFANLHGAVDWGTLVVFGVLCFLGTVIVLYGVFGAGRRA